MSDLSEQAGFIVGIAVVYICQSLFSFVHMLHFEYFSLHFLRCDLVLIDVAKSLGGVPIFSDLLGRVMPSVALVAELELVNFPILS